MVIEIAKYAAYFVFLSKGVCGKEEEEDTSRLGIPLGIWPPPPLDLKSVHLAISPYILDDSNP